MGDHASDGRANTGPSLSSEGDAPVGLAGEFYAYCSRGELRVQRCECGTWRHPPRVRCASCCSDRWVWQQSSGRGRVFSWTVVHQAMHPAFVDRVPYALVVVETEEGMRVVTFLGDADPSVLHLELPVELGFEESTDGVALLVAQPVA